MRPSPFNTGLACMYFIICSSALPRSKDYNKPSGSDYSQPEKGKGSSVLGQGSKEPSCQELRVMWRFSKRQSRAAEITNEIPTYRDPFSVNVWEEYAKPRSAGYSGRFRKPIYGRVIHNVPRPGAAFIPERSPEAIKNLEEVARIFGPMYPYPRSFPQRKTSFRLSAGFSPLSQPHGSMQEPLSGSFQHLKELIIAERARELQEQRMSEEAAVRAKSLNDVVGNTHLGRLPQDQKLHPSIYDRTSISPNSVGTQQAGVLSGRNRGVLAFPDPLASSHYLEEDLLPSSALASYKTRPYSDDDSIEEFGSKPWSTW